MNVLYTKVLFCLGLLLTSCCVNAQTLLESAGALKLGTTAITGDGILRYHSGEYEVWKNGNWESLSTVAGTLNWTNTGTNIYNSNSGNVGVGTTSPQDELHIKGNAHLLTLEGSSHAYIQYYPLGFAAGRQAWVGFSSPGTDFYITNQSATGDLRLRTSNLDRIVILDNGRTGVGRANPDTRLHVGGAIRSSYTTVSDEYTEMWHGGGNGFINTVGDGNLEFRHDNNTKMSLTDLGQLVIGSVATPGDYMLYVENGILTEEVKVAIESSADWSDDAFDRLPSIAAVEKSIENNSHLYTMPSADSLVDSGYSVTEMDSKLLEQIEWLWMYTIDSDKDNAKLKEELVISEKRNEELESRLKSLESIVEGLVKTNNSN